MNRQMLQDEVNNKYYLRSVIDNVSDQPISLYVFVKSGRKRHIL